MLNSSAPQGNPYCKELSLNFCCTLMCTKLLKINYFQNNITMNETKFYVFLAFQRLVGLYNLDKLRCKQNIKMCKYVILITYYNLFSRSRYI